MENKDIKQDIKEYHIEEHPPSKSNLFIDNDDDFVINNNNIDYDEYSNDVSLVIKRD